MLAVTDFLFVKVTMNELVKNLYIFKAWMIDKVSKGTKKSEDNVVKFNKATAHDKTIKLGKTLSKIQKKFILKMTPILDQYFTELDDDFFQKAERAENNEQQNHYFDAMREVRRKKELILADFKKKIITIFKEFKSSNFDYFNQDNTTESSQESTLSLVSEDELDEKLAISNTVARADTFLHDELYGLEKRFSLLAGGTELQVNHIPISPDAIVRSFASALNQLTADLAIILSVLKKFEYAILRGLKPIYNEINEDLKSQGILSDLKFSVSVKTGGQQTPNSHFAPQNPHQNPIDSQYQEQLSHSDISHPQNSVPTNAAGVTNNMANNVAGGMVNAGYIFEPSIIGQALGLLQQDELQSLDLNETGLSPTEIKNKLLKKLREVDSSDKVKEVKKQDEDIIDIVGMLFQFLVEDRNLPDKIQILLVKLQIPFLHLALQDPTLFTNKNNKARRILDLMSQSTVGWSESTDKKGEYIKKIEAIVHFILANQQNKIDYGELIEDYESFLQTKNKKVKIKEKRTAEKEKGQEKLLNAKRKAAKILKAKIQNAKRPKLIMDILLNHWAGVLVFAFLREDKDNILQTKINFVKRLMIVSDIENKSTVQLDTIKMLCGYLKRELQTVTGNAEKSNQIAKALFRLLAIMHQSNQQNKEKQISQESLKTTQVESEIADLIQSENTDDSTNQNIETLKDEESMEQAKKLKVGQWVEFTDATDEGENVRAKLSWISPFSKKLLFVNSQGLKFKNFNITELALLFDNKAITLLKHNPVFDRALAAIKALKDSPLIKPLK